LMAPDTILPARYCNCFLIYLNHIQKHCSKQHQRNQKWVSQMNCALFLKFYDQVYILAQS
ncbi:hypothetical protein, partial [Acinetobacter baumannii]|uniref:hypothetical protein n=1 Tax=Acinetobacter baumannii TaxID=470 RepID=UPI001C0774CE